MSAETIFPQPHGAGAGASPVARPVTPPLNPLDHLLDPSSSNFSDSESEQDGAQAQKEKATLKAEQLVPEQRHSIIKEEAVIRYYLDARRDPALIVGAPGACDGQAGAKGGNDDSVSEGGEKDRTGHLDVSLLLDVTNGCGGKIWPAAQVLGAYLTGRRDELEARWKGKKVVELGSGTGLVGFVLAKMRIGAHTWVTDQE